MPKELLIKYEPALGFVVLLEGDEEESFDPVEYFLDCIHEWVMNTHPDDIRENVTMQEF